MLLKAVKSAKPSLSLYTIHMYQCSKKNQQRTSTEKEQTMSIARKVVREQGLHVHRQFRVLTKKNSTKNVSVISIRYGGILHFILSH